MKVCAAMPTKKERNTVPLCVRERSPVNQTIPCSSQPLDLVGGGLLQSMRWVEPYCFGGA